MDKAEALGEALRALAPLEGAARLDALLELAAKAQGWGIPGRALAALEEALPLAESLGRPLELAFAQLGLVRLREGQGRLGDAILAAEGAGAGLVALGLRDKAAAVYRDLGRLRRQSGDGPGALEALTRSLALAEEVGDGPGVRGAQLDLGLLSLALGDHSGALGHLDLLLEAPTIADQPQVFGVIGRARGACLAALGRWEEARDAFMCLLKAAEQLSDLPGQIIALMEICRCEDALGHKAEAWAAGEGALALARGGHPPGALVACLGLVAGLAEGGGELARAAALHRERRERALAQGDGGAATESEAALERLGG